eukprot:CAMPEP_0172162958 /NCGR_PEP_ID=MMETSP1050-20130122/6994_1 /TAXON_ID=233186 /ORGANISM="Cryptomonas curvata, Strain CCAP979/52" /LENGTH=92 /DNA_ID=CAMNT_0012833073 /DNA_START=553 /DNA_END=831 /DNA_ORIENTATION=-
MPPSHRRAYDHPYLHSLQFERLDAAQPRPRALRRQSVRQRRRAGPARAGAVQPLPPGPSLQHVCARGQQVWMIGDGRDDLEGENITKALITY